MVVASVKLIKEKQGGITVATMKLLKTTKMAKKKKKKNQNSIG